MIGRKKNQAPDPSRQALLWMHPEALFRFMVSKRWVIQDGHLPDDVTFHHVYYDERRQVFACVVTSNSFKSLKAGQPLPELPPITFKWWNHEDGAVS